MKHQTHIAQSIILLFLFVISLCFSACNPDKPADQDSTTEGLTSSGTFTADRVSKIELFGNISSRVEEYISYDDQIRHRLYLYGRIKNISDKAARYIDLSIDILDMNGKVLPYWQYMSIYGDQLNNRDKGYGNYLLPGNIAIFESTIENFNDDMESMKCRLMWYDGETYCPESIIQLDSDSIRLIQGDYRPEIFVTAKNTGPIATTGFSAVIAAVDQYNNILGIFTGYNNTLPKKTHCYFDGDIFTCIDPGESIELETSTDDKSLPLGEIASYEFRTYASSCENITPVNGAVTFIARSQDGPCSSFDRSTDGGQINFFRGCGYSFEARGMNIAVMDPSDGTLFEFKTFDTWLSSDDSRYLADYLPTIPDGMIVLLSVADEATMALSDAAIDAIGTELGSKLIRSLTFRDGFALITIKGEINENYPIEKMSEYDHNDTPEVEVQLIVNMPM